MHKSLLDAFFVFAINVFALLSRMHYLKFVNLSEAAQKKILNWIISSSKQRKIFTSNRGGQRCYAHLNRRKNPDDRHKKVNIFITSSLMTKIVDCRFTSSFVVVFAGVKKG